MNKMEVPHKIALNAALQSARKLELEVPCEQSPGFYCDSTALTACEGM